VPHIGRWVDFPFFPGSCEGGVAHGAKLCLGGVEVIPEFVGRAVDEGDFEGWLGCGSSAGGALLLLHREEEDGEDAEEAEGGADAEPFDGVFACFAGKVGREDAGDEGEKEVGKGKDHVFDS